MKKSYLFIFVLFASFIISTCMYSFSSSNNSHCILSIDNDGEWEELILTSRTGSGNPAVIATKTVSLFKPIRLFLNQFSLKINILLNEKVNIKVTDCTGFPVYLRQFIPGSSNETIVDISGWSSGTYTIVFTNTSGEIITNSEFNIR
jgi:Protein of unknown function (DUF3244).